MGSYSKTNKSNQSTPLATFSDIYFDQLETVEVEYCGELNDAFESDPDFSDGYDNVLDEMKDFIITGEVADVAEFANKIDALEDRFEGQTDRTGEQRATEILYEVYGNMLYIFA